MNQDIGRAIGDRLRRCRDARNLTQADLADLCNKSTETISNIERGRTIPSVRSLADIAGHLGVSLRDLMDIESPTLPEPSTDGIETLIAKVRQLPDPDRELLIGLADLMIARHRSN